MDNLSDITTDESVEGDSLLGSDTAPSEPPSDDDYALSDGPDDDGTPRREQLNTDECLAAIRGESVPDDLSSETAQAAVVRGVRLHYAFATSPAITESQIPKVRRARNARRIMSNEIPDDLEDPELQPYCIWHPDFASEETYRQLFRRYPSMRYHVGRACAAAGYADLYDELDLLPDVSIAEEARESERDGAETIFEKIMKASVRFAVMDDYTRSVNTVDPKVALLNADTVVRYNLRSRVTPFADEIEYLELPSTPADIEEDGRLGLEYVSWATILEPEDAELLHKPLPLDLPTMDKDLLINMAAYDGNIDRYARLRHPGRKVGRTERHCIVHGIYHHTMFARRWLDELEENPQRVDTCIGTIRSAINARRIMTNDISGLDNESECLPYLIWWPLRPSSNTLHFLSQRCPQMNEQIAITAIICDYEEIYARVDIKPSWILWRAAKKSSNDYYAQDLLKRAAELDINITDLRMDYDGIWEYLEDDLEPTEDVLVSAIHADSVYRDSHRHFSSGRALSGIVDRHVWASPELRRKVEIDGGYWYGDTEYLEEIDEETLRKEQEQ